jgi:hypothetical protein
VSSVLPRKPSDVALDRVEAALEEEVAAVDQVDLRALT